MAGPKFTNLFVAEMRPALTIEDMYKQLASYGGIHKFSFDSLIEIDEFAQEGWDTSEGVWSFEAGLMNGSPTTSSGFKVAWWTGANANLPSSYVLEVRTGGGQHNTVIAFRGNGSGDFYAVHIGQGDVSFYKVQDNVWTLLENADYANVTDVFLGPATVRLAVRQVMFSENEIDRWLFMSVWVDDRLMLSSRDHLPESSPGLKFGLGYKSGDPYDAATYTYLRVPDMTEILPWASIDPGETPYDGIQRAIADRVIKMFIRHDGTLRAWRPKPTPVSQTFGSVNAGELLLAEEVDLRELYTHVRLYYALDWVETFDGDNYEAYGHRFIEMTNTYIEDEHEAIREVEAILRRFKENSRRITFRTNRGGLLLEPEDRVALPNGNSYIIDSITFEYKNNGLFVSVRGRRYSW